MKTIVKLTVKSILLLIVFNGQCLKGINLYNYKINFGLRFLFFI